MIKATCFDGSVFNPAYSAEEKDGCTVVTIHKDLDSSNIKYIDFEYYEEIALSGDNGYMVIPNEGMICTFRERENAEYISERYAMPVFGVKTDKDTFLAVVTGMAYDYSLVCGVKSGKYYVYPRFNIDGDNLYEDISISYFHLSGKDADYSGMARTYRKYQLERGECVPIKERVKDFPCLEYARDSVMIRIRMGWKPVPSPQMHQTPLNEPQMITACSFDRVGEIIDELKNQGVEKAEICLVGWNCKGHDGRWPQAFPVEEELGGEQALRCLIKKAQSMGYQIVCHTNSTDTYEISEMWDKDDLIINKDGSLPKDAPWSGGQMYQICPAVALKQAEEILPQVAELGFKGIHYIDVLNIVMPRKCYNEKHMLNVKESMEVSRELMKLAKEQFGGYSSEGGYDFGAKYLDFALNLDYGEKKKNPLCDYDVPFWQLVYHGIILSNPSMTETLNFSLKENSEAAKLKLIEYGGRPTYYYYSVFRDDWRAAENSDLVCNNDEQLKHGVSCIKLGYDLCAELSYLQNEFMEKHEILSDNIHRVTYSDNTVVTVDYDKLTYTVERM
ncbi:MAG: DUF5696 domain-containing protein [Acutalibacteraceae bacterium]